MLQFKAVLACTEHFASTIVNFKIILYLELSIFCRQNYGSCTQDYAGKMLKFKILFAKSYIFKILQLTGVYSPP